MRILNMRKNPKFCVRVRSGYSMIRVRFCSRSEYFKKIRFVLGSSCVNVGFGFGSVRVLHQWNWKYVSVVAICYGLTVVVSTS